MKLAPTAAAIKDAPPTSSEQCPSRPVSDAQLRTGRLLSYFISLLLAGSAIAKFIAVPKVAEQMASVGFAGGRLTFIAALEITSVLLFAFPRTRFFGLLMVSAYLGG